MKEKILLLNIYYEDSGYGKKLNFPPLGIAYISEYLDQRNPDWICIRRTRPG